MIRFLPLPLVLATMPALAAVPADLSAIEQAAEQFAGAPVAPLDPRLRLAQCQQAPALSWSGSQHDTVLVQCPSAGGWRLYLQLANRPAAAQAPVVARGDAVMIRLGGTGFAVSQSGEALEAGAVGVWIKVRTAKGKGEPLRARVLRPGLVGIDLP
jgi:flagella basal body P-ring formation protein FlgA